MLEKKSSARQNERLIERRRRRRRRGIAFFIILLLLLCVSAVYGLQQNAVRISRIHVFGENPAVTQIASEAIKGDYFGIIPRDSIFFFPEDKIRSELLVKYPNIAAVSIYRNDFSSISIKTDERVPVARWCGDYTRLNLGDYTRLNLVQECYLFDAKGFIFATTSAISTVNSFSLYEPILQDNSPIGSILPNAKKLPSVFDFARELSTFGSPVSKIVIRNDEVDDYLESGTRITYLLGDEENAFTALMSARGNFNLVDGSIEYLDVRFNGKIYLKKKNEVDSTNSP